MVMTINDGVPGIGDPGRLIGWLAANGVRGAARLRGIELIAGGRSNLTYRLDFGAGPADGHGLDRSCGWRSRTGRRRPVERGGAGTPHDGEHPGRLVLRRPPLGHVLPTAHDMSREFRVLSALSGTLVPVPTPVALCADEDVIGAPFYVMQYVDGLILRTQQDGEKITTLQAARYRNAWPRPWPRFTRWISTPSGSRVSANRRGTSPGSSSAGSGSGSCPRPVRFPSSPGWSPGLRSGCRTPGKRTLVHGDFRLDNLLIRLEPQPRVAAVVDWEMSTLGDPLADLGLTLSYWTDPGDTERLGIELAGAITSRPGFLSGAGFAGRYAELTGRDVSAIGYYVAFGCFKLAVVLEGIHARFLQDKTVGEGFDQAGSGVPCSSAGRTGCSTSWADTVMSEWADSVMGPGGAAGTAAGDPRPGPSAARSQVRVEEE